MPKISLQKIPEIMGYGVLWGISTTWALVPLLGVLYWKPNGNLFGGHPVGIALLAAILVFVVTMLTLQVRTVRRPYVGPWLVSTTAYGWLMASTILRPTKITLWSANRDVLDQLFMLPAAVSVLCAILLFGALGFSLALGRVLAALEAKQAKKGRTEVQP